MIHLHRWEAIAVQHGEFVIVPGLGTTVLWRCSRCPRTKTIAENGIWSLSHFQTKASDAAGERCD